MLRRDAFIIHYFTALFGYRIILDALTLPDNSLLPFRDSACHATR